MNNNTGDKLKIAVTGASGLVGSRVIELLGEDFHFLPLNQDEMDITDATQVKKVLSKMEYDLFLHLAAYTNVDRAEEQKDLCMKINVEGTKNVFEEVVKKDKPFIYISTDFVFSGKNPPYDENSKPNAEEGIYSLSKLQGEKVVGDKAMIVRTAFPYRSSYEQRPDFVRTLKKLLEGKKEVKMVTDSQFTPTFIDDIAYGLSHLFTNYSPEVFHLVGAQSLSPYEACMLIAHTFDLDTSLIGEITFREFFKDKAPRPQKAVIKSVKNDFQEMKSFSEGLIQTKKQMEG